MKKEIEKEKASGEAVTWNIDALVVIAKIGSCKVHRILVNDGNSVNLLSYSAYSRMGLHNKYLRRVNASIYGFTGNYIKPKGSIKLSITLGTAPQEATSVAEFMVVDELITQPSMWLLGDLF